MTSPLDKDPAASNVKNTPRERRNRHPAILRFSATAVAGLLAALMVTAVLPPIVADQSGRAVVDAPVALLTALVSGEIDSIVATPGSEVGAGDRLAQISNPRLDRSTLIALEEKEADAREKLDATPASRQSDHSYVASLDAEIASQTDRAAQGSTAAADRGIAGAGRAIRGHERWKKGVGASFRSGVVSAVLPKTSDKIDERFAVPFPQTERRELYVIIAPDAANADVASAPGTAGAPPACMVGQWVTVTRDNGVVPSMSVTWREIGNLLTSWSGHDDGQTASAAATPHAGILQAGLAKLQSVLRLSSAHLTPNLKGQWLP